MRGERSRRKSRRSKRRCKEGVKGVVFHLAAAEVLAELPALTTVTEAAETTGSVETLLYAHTLQTLIHVCTHTHTHTHTHTL